MSFITLINDEIVSCVTNDFVLNKEQVREISNVSQLVEEISNYKRDEINRIHEAEKQGFEDGYKQGLDECYKDVQDKYNYFIEKTLEQIISTHTLTKELILDLALEITRKIALDIGSEEMILGMANNALRNYKRNENIKIKLHAELAEKIQKRFKDLTKQNGLQVEIIPDQRIGKLDCIIISENGVTDASFEPQLKIIEQEVKRVIKDKYNSENKD